MTTPDTQPAATDPALVAPLGAGQAAAVAAVLQASHADYPSFRHLVADPARRRRLLGATFTAVARDALPFGAVYGATEGGRLLGAAVWLPPGRFPWSPARQLRGAPWFLAALRAAPRSFPAYMRMGRNALRLFPDGPHWYLEVLGVRPEAQGRGLGTRLLRPVLDQADRDGVACFLETADPANVAFYQPLGFRLEGELQLLPSGPRHLAMRRAPREA
jgi:hypothetical protein